MNSSELPVNETVLITNNKFIQVTMIRNSNDDIQTLYRDPSNFDIVLDIRTKVSDNDSYVESFDKAFWTITVNDKAVTEQDLEDLTRNPGINIKVDPTNRTLTFTTPRPQM